MKYVLLILLSFSFQFCYCSDRASIYYIPVYSSFNHRIVKEDIDIKTDGFVITDSLILQKLFAVINDSIQVKNLYNSKLVSDVRILITYYSDNNVVKELMISQNNLFATINNKKCKVKSLAPLYNFIRQNLKPETDRQKRFFIFP